MFSVFLKTGTLKLWQTMYCNGKHERCARYTLQAAGKPVPAMLLPNGEELGKG